MIILSSLSLSLSLSRALSLLSTVILFGNNCFPACQDFIFFHICCDGAELATIHNTV
jgi:hypothetical protein